MIVRKNKIHQHTLSHNLGRQLDFYCTIEQWYA